MKNLFELIDIADEYLKTNKNIKQELITEIQNIVKNNHYIGMAQINTISGDIEYNAEKIAKYIKFATDIELEAVIFPELSLTGFPLEDTVYRHPIIINENVKWLNGLAKITKDTAAIVGFIEPCKDGKYYNSAAIMQNGKIESVIRKSIIPNNSISNDIKYQKSYNAKNNYTFSKDSIEYGILIGEDCLNTKYQVDLLTHKPKLLINSSALPINQNNKHINMLSYLSSKIKLPFIYVNQVGANDNIMFDGISCAYNSEGKLIARAKAFEEQFIIVNPYQNIGNIYPLPKGFEENTKKQNEFSLNYENDMERTYKALILGIKDYFNKCGLKRAVLGLSGGLDSTVCAVLLADAIGKENVFGISMPSHITSKESTSDAEKLANNLGINYAEAPIRSMIDTTTECFNKLFSQVENSWKDRYKKSFTPDNIQARSRAMYLWGVSNEFPSCIPIATSDKSEAYMGYATINGDMSGGFAPIADITKTKLFALARWLNKNRDNKNAIPETIILKRPGAELAINPKTGKPLIAEDALMPYEFLDEIIWRIENNHETYIQMLNSKFIYEKNNDVTSEQKTEWLNKFYKRMSGAFYKWSIMPPYVAIEQHSINKCDYKQLITSSHINYIGVTEEYINENLMSNSNV